MSRHNDYGSPPGYPGDEDRLPSHNSGASMRLLTDNSEAAYVPSISPSASSQARKKPTPQDLYLKAQGRLNSFNSSTTDLDTGNAPPYSPAGSRAPRRQQEHGQEEMSSLLQDTQSDLSQGRSGFRSGSPAGRATESQPRTRYYRGQFKRREHDGSAAGEANIPDTASGRGISPSPLQRSYQPTASVPIGRHSVVGDAVPQMPPPIGRDGPTSYDPYRPVSRAGSLAGYGAQSSPPRPYSPSRISISGNSAADYTRPPPTSNPYEPADINGAPRPGTPASQYGGASPKRPLPPAPLFAAGRPTSRSSLDMDMDKEPGMTSIPIDDDISDSRARLDEDDDVFGPPTSSTVTDNSRHGELRGRDSFVSEATLTDSLYGDVDEKSSELYGPAPIGKQERRGARQAQMTKKEVKLINGELVLECKIPTILYSFLPRRDDVEFTHMRYTAVTCDPDEFVERGYKLRQNIGSTERETELFICVTMYNEDEILFTRTMHGVMRNIAHFCSRGKSRTWGKDGWQKIVVCVISDGRAKVHPRTLDALAAMGCYQSGIAKNSVNQKDVTAHVYEYTTQVSLDSDLKFKGAEKGIVPCQMIFCLKEKNAKKLNSHRWFFNAFGRALNPNVCILLDVGTKPGEDSLYHLWKAFDRDSNVAGAAGEIVAAKGKGWVQLLNPLVASQNFEYKMSNILDKPLESVFGYITVLPGALSAYRYHALQNDENGHGPLSQYFKGETLHGQDADVFTANMYLAEDRILCWELVAKRSEKWVLKYVRNAYGETDVPDGVPEFVSQRRRWLNGAFFAAVYSLSHFKQIWATDHSIARKILLHVEFVYQFLQLLFTFFSLGNFYLAFYFIAGSLADPRVDPFGHGVGAGLFTLLRYICVLTIMVQFILSMGNRPQGAKRMFMISLVVFSVIMVYNTFATIYIIVREFKDSQQGLGFGNNVFTNLIVSTLSTVGLYFIMSFLYMDPWHMFTSSAQYFALLPSYICTLQVYAFCNAHDVTWGTKGDNVMNKDLGVAKASKDGKVELEMPSEQLDIDSGYDEALRNLRDRVEVPAPSTSESQMQEDYYRAVRTYVVIVWMTANAVLAMGVSEIYGGTHIGNNLYLKFILWSVAILAMFRAIGSSTFLIMNVVHSIAEGRMKWANRGKRSNPLAGASVAGRRVGGVGWTSRVALPGWMSSMGGWVGGKFEKAGSSIGSTLGR